MTIQNGYMNVTTAPTSQHQEENRTVPPVTKQTLTIEKGVPLDSARRRVSIIPELPFEEMEKGDSVRIMIDPEDSKTARALRSRASRRNSKGDGKHFSVVKCATEGDHVFRVFRVE